MFQSIERSVIAFQTQQFQTLLELHVRRMPRLSKEQRDEAREMIAKGWSMNKTAKKMNSTIATIRKLIERFKETGSVVDRPRTGRPRTMPKVNSLWFECSGEERPFVCVECGKTFKTFKSLKAHIKIHSDTHEIQCEHCGKGFCTNSNFQRHLKSHSKEKPYICEYCARRFTDLSSLRPHIRTHTGERPHKCHLCPYSCSTAGNLHAHMKVHRDKVNGTVPKPIVNLTRSQSVPVFTKEELLQRAKKKWKGVAGQNKLISFEEAKRLSKEFTQQIANFDFDEKQREETKDPIEDREFIPEIKQEPNDDYGGVDTVGTSSYTPGASSQDSEESWTENKSV